MKLHINEELRDLIPPLSIEERSTLEQSLISEGCRDAIVTWNGTIIDGHNRYELCTKNGIHFRTEEKQFDTIDDVKQWMIVNQFGRRNLSAYQRSLLALELETLYRRKAKENQGKRTDILQNSAESIKPLDTRKELATIANVSHDTIAKVKVIKEKAPEEVKKKLETGELTIHGAYKEIKNEEKKEQFKRRVEEFKKQPDKVESTQSIIHGDCIDVLKSMDSCKFDLLLTDPPYGMDFKSGWSDKNKIKNDKIEDTVNLFENMLVEAKRVLKDDAHFYIFGSIDYISEIRPIIEKHLYLLNVLIWDRQIIGMGNLKTYGKSYDVIYFGYNKTFKQLNGVRDRDVISYKRSDPNSMVHPTEKPIELLEFLIKKSTNAGDSILDPFCGGGSTLIASKNLFRIATGVEIEEDYYNLILSRI